MKLTCLLGQHWPIAAFSPARDGFECSECADCGRPLAKTSRVDWHVPRLMGRRPAVDQAMKAA